MRLSRVIAGVLVVGCCASSVHAAATPWWEACRQIVLDYAYFRDRPDADGVASLFTDDARFKLGPDEFRGRDAIHARIAAGVGGPVFRHLMSTIRIEPTGPDTARGVSYATVYSAPAGALPRPVGPFLAIGEYHDVFRKTDAGCRIADREFVMALVPQEH